MEKKMTEYEKKVKAGLARPNMKLRYLVERFELDYRSERTLVFAFSRGRTKELSELKPEECAELDKHLRRTLIEIPPVDEPVIRRIKKLCQELEWMREDGQACENTLNEFLRERSSLNKRFRELDSVELSRLMYHLILLRDTRSYIKM